ncbi:hypothetical protein EV646_10767 [Kribbella antiqua]|uniref:Uncharacterized protein n=1 Tax=Kribbella antiqua TaxID=2512217 RepID=A0A4R2INT2_9ACTN|nr:hypothetical protein [Kribbella antiqua]TCO46046.1 hypothetical protein EV646_10767 [Kribbella antiqua]
MALIQGIPGEFGPQPWGEAVLRSCELLLRITRRPANHEVRLPGLATTPRHVVEDGTGRALTWRRDGDDLVVRLPHSDSVSGASIVRVALQGKLRIVPPDTVTAHADGVWVLTPTGATSHLVARRSADVAVRVFGDADGDSRVELAHQSYVVPDLGRTVGPFAVPAGLVVPLTVEAASVRRILVAPVGTVVASIHPADGGVSVVVTNFGRTVAHGEAVLPLPTGRCRWAFEDLRPGASVSWPAAVSGSGELRVQLDAGRRSASAPYLLQ